MVEVGATSSLDSPVYCLLFLIQSELFFIALYFQKLFPNIFSLLILYPRISVCRTHTDCTIRVKPAGYFVHMTTAPSLTTSQPTTLVRETKHLLSCQVQVRKHLVELCFLVFKQKSTVLTFQVLPLYRKSTKSAITTVKPSVPFTTVPLPFATLVSIASICKQLEIRPHYSW